MQIQSRQPVQDPYQNRHPKNLITKIYSGEVTNALQFERYRDRHCYYSSKGYNPLTAAIVKGYSELTAAILRWREDLLNTVDGYGNRPLCLATGNLNAKFKANAIDLEGAAGYKCIEVLMAFKPANINSLDNKKRSPLYLSIIRRDEKAVKLLLRHGAKILPPLQGKHAEYFNKLCRGLYDPNNFLRPPSIESLVLFSDAEAVRKRLQINPFELNSRSEGGETLLHLAVARSTPQVAVKLTQTLLEFSPNINAMDYFGETPLNVCVRIQNIMVGALLLSKGAKLGLPLTNMLEKHTYDQMAIRADPKINPKRLKQYNQRAEECSSGSLVYKIFKGIIGTMEEYEQAVFEDSLSIPLRCQFRLDNGDGLTTLAAAATRYNEVLIAGLLKKDPTIVNLKSLKDNTALHTLARTSYKNAYSMQTYQRDVCATAKKLVENGADINLYNINKQTPLFYCILTNKLSMAKYLIAKGAKIVTFRKEEDRQKYKTIVCETRFEQVKQMHLGYHDPTSNLMESGLIFDIFKLFLRQFNMLVCAEQSMIEIQGIRGSL